MNEKLAKVIADFEDVLKAVDASYIICIDEGNIVFESVGGSYLKMLGMCEEMKFYITQPSIRRAHDLTRYMERDR